MNRHEILKEIGDKCIFCGWSHRVCIHHIIPKRLGGTDEPDNLVPLCHNHHIMIHSLEKRSTEEKKFVDFLRNHPKTKVFDPLEHDLMFEKLLDHYKEKQKKKYKKNTTSEEKTMELISDRLKEKTMTKKDLFDLISNEFSGSYKTFSRICSSLQSENKINLTRNMGCGGNTTFVSLY